MKSSEIRLSHCLLGGLLAFWVFFFSGSGICQSPDKGDLRETQTDLWVEEKLATVTPNAQGILSLEYQQAIQLAILNNLKTLRAEEQFHEAQGNYLSSLSGLLPNLNSSVNQYRRTSNIVAEGLDPSTTIGLPLGVYGPYNHFNARITLLQNIFNLEAIGNFQAGQSGVRLAKLKIILARQLVASTAGKAYVEVWRRKSEVEAARSDLQLSKMLLRNTEASFRGGTVTAADLARAETNYSQNTTRLLHVESQEKIARFNLKKILMLPMSTPLTLTTSLKATGPQAPTPTSAYQIAEAKRPDIKVAKEEIVLRGYEHRAAVGRQVPSLAFGAGYGGSGITPTDQTAGVYQVAGQLTIPIFDGGHTLGQIKSAKSKKKQAQLYLGSLLQEVSEEIYVALEKLNTAKKEIQSTQQTLDYSQKELRMAKVRYLEGLTDNLEVIKAQSSLALAKQNHIGALANYNEARIDLATALGNVVELKL